MGEGTRRTLLIACLLAALVGVFLPRANPLTSSAENYASDVAAASAAVYITLRTLNAFLSAAQEIEVEGSLVVVSGTGQPLKILEPIDDTIERVAGFIFAMMVATGILAVAMGPVGSVGFAMVALALAISLVSSRRGNGMLRVLSQRLGWYGGFLGAGVPLAFVLASASADALTSEVWDQHTAVIAEITAEVGTPDTEVTEESWFQRMRAAQAEVNRYSKMAGNIYARADDLIASYVAILAVFTFKIFLLPGLILGGMFVAARFFARRDDKVA